MVKNVGISSWFPTFIVPLQVDMNINLLTEAQLTSLQQLIADANNIIVCCHKSPDGDAIGSSLGWAEYLRALGKDPTVVVPDADPDFLQWLPGSE